MLTKNLFVLREALGYTKTEISEKLDISRMRWDNYETGKREPDIAMLIKFSKFFKLPIDVLVKADLSKTDYKALMKLGENRTMLPIIVTGDNKDTIEVIPVKSKAGYLAGYSDPQYFEKLPLMNLPFKTAGKLRAFPIEGNSMPPVNDGSIVVGRFVESWNDIENGSTYVILSSTEGLVYKRVYKKGNTLELHSDNQSYKSYTIKRDEVLELWRFVCYLNQSDKREGQKDFERLHNLLNKVKDEIAIITR